MQSISSHATSAALRHLITRTRAELVKAQQESSTGSVADVGLALGSRTGQTLSFRQEYDRLHVLKDMNALVQERMKVTQAATGKILASGQEFMKNLTGATRAAESAATIAKAARSVLEGATGLLNSSFKGEYVFAGVNTDVKPVNEYKEGSAAQKAVRQAFEDHFGFAMNDPKVANITGEEMEAFLKGDFASQFDDANWARNWSKASDTPVKNRISPTETVETSVSANAEGFRKTIMSAVMMAEFATIGLNGSAFEALKGQATQMSAEGISGATAEQARLGLSEARIKEASDHIDAQQHILERSVNDLEAVDPYEAKTRFDILKTQLEMAFSLTVQLQNISLLRYLK